MNNKNPKISVVIPAYNEEKYITKCLESIKRQTFRDFELIVVDNNSTDKTAEIARQFGARVVKEKIQGMIPARERGFREAKADIIARTDGDSFVPLNWLSSIFEIFEQDKQIVAVSGGHYTSNGLKILSPIINFYINYLTFYLTRFLIGHYQLSGPNYAIRKTAWEKVTVHKDDHLVHEDMDLACHLATLGKIEFHPEIKTGYSLRRFKRDFLNSTIDYVTRYFRTILIHHPNFRRNH